MGNDVDSIEGNVGAPGFDPAHVGAHVAAALGELFLREAGGSTQLTNSGAEAFSQGRAHAHLVQNAHQT